MQRYFSLTESEEYFLFYSVIVCKKVGVGGGVRCKKDKIKGLPQTFYKSQKDRFEEWQILTNK